MRKPNWLISAAFLLHAVAWLLPVTTDGVTLPDGLPGWQAFRAAACAVWPYEPFGIDDWYNVILFTLSAATTLLFVLVSGSVVAFGTRGLRRASARIAASAFIINAHWFRFGSGLRVGYFLWWFSFMLLALGLFALSRRVEDQ